MCKQFGDYLSLNSAIRRADAANNMAIARGLRGLGASMATINGSAGNDSISGSSAADTVYGGGGKDTVNAGSGNDVVMTGSGTDSINGGDGNDSIESGDGNDTVFGGNGYDQIYAGDGDDKLYGGSDVYDDIYGGAGNDTIYAGNSTNDWTYGGTGNDVIYSDQGDDKSFGDEGNDTLYGGDGADTLDGGADNDLLSGGAGNDSLIGGAGTDTIYGGTGEDVAYGGTENDIIYGEDGQDTLYGGDGKDSLAGGNDNDSIMGEAGDDSLFGGAGADVVYGGDGNDTIGSFSVEDAGDDTVYGDAGDDWINGGAGNDAVYGGIGDDTLSGQMGNDTLYGGDGADDLTITDDHEGDTIYGGEGGTDDDALYFSNWISTQGVQVNFSGSEAGSYSYYGSNASGDFSQIETIYTTDYGDSINATAATSSMNLYGGGGADTIIGGAGADLIAGGIGSDVLAGGAGDDMLVGGTGADVFRFDQSGGADTITDFDTTLADGKTTDQLDVSDLRTPQNTPVRYGDIIVSDDGNGNALLKFPEGEEVVLQGVSPAYASNKQNMARMGIPCFTKGTSIRTPQGERLVESLRAGDIVLTADHGPQPLLWVGRRGVTRSEMLRKPQLFPIRLRGALASPDLVVSRQHGVLVAHQGRQVLVRAGHLADHGINGAQQCLGAKNAIYYHLLLAEHALLWSNDVLSESFYPGPVALQSLGGKSCLSLLRAFPVLEKVLTGQQAVGTVYGLPVRPILSRKAAASIEWAGITQIENNASLSGKPNQSAMVLQPLPSCAPANDFAKESVLR